MNEGQNILVSRMVNRISMDCRLGHDVVLVSEWGSDGSTLDDDFPCQVGLSARCEGADHTLKAENQVKLGKLLDVVV